MKYEVKTLSAYEFIDWDSERQCIADNPIPHANILLKQAQDDGWEIAGPIVVTKDGNSNFKNHMVIPLRRELKDWTYLKKTTIHDLLDHNVCSVRLWNALNNHIKYGESKYIEDVQVLELKKYRNVGKVCIDEFVRLRGY